MRLDSMSARALAAVAATVVIGACNKPTTMDAGLKNDLAAVGNTQTASALELAPTNSNQQVVVSPIEGGPQSAPAPAAHKVVTRPTPKPTKHLAAREDPAPVPMPQPQRAEPAPTPAPQPPQQQAEPAPLPQRQAEPAPLPPAPSRARGEDRGGATEGQIFQRMPWIRP